MCFYAIYILAIILWAIIMRLKLFDATFVNKKTQERIASSYYTIFEVSCLYIFTFFYLFAVAPAQFFMFSRRFSASRW